MASHTLEQVCVHMSSTYVRKLDHVYADPYAETIFNIEQSRNLKRTI